jgi:molybdopterin/thiamine biosynthesis adenylyltransferase
MRDHKDALSRPLACAAALGRHAADAGRFLDKRVLLTGNIDILDTANGRWIAVDSLRLLIRICRSVDVWIPLARAPLRGELETLARQIEFTQPVQFLERAPNIAGYDAVLNIGSGVPGRNGTTINANGWLARISSGGAVPGDSRIANPIAALAAASLGVSEIFKRLVNVRPERGAYFDALVFSLFTLETSQDPGPELARMNFPTTLVAGQGAIGNGIVLLLSQLGLKGDIFLLDRQAYEPENLGTCVLLGPNGIGKSKADENALWLEANSALTVKPAHGDLGQLLQSFGKEVARPTLVLNGLDNVEARHLVQELWPDVLIDGAIGDFSCQAAAYLWGQDMACLKCLFDLPPGADPERLAVAETGFAAARIRDPEAVVTLQDIEAAPAAKRELLRASVGRKICSVVSDVMRAKITQDQSSAHFSPSVPFVATMSATLVVAMLMRHLLGHRLDTARYYMDLLVGPATAERFNERPLSKCYCVKRRDLIAQYRQQIR